MTRIVAYRPRLCHPAAVPSSPSRTIVAWTLYDFANSAFAAVVLATIYPAYYANAVVGNATGHGDFLWGTAISTAMVIGALTSPLLGGVADHAGARKSFLIGFTAVCVAATALMATVSAGMVLWGWVLAVVGVVTYEAAIVYYNSYLPRIAPREQLGRVSAAGFAVGYAGTVVTFAGIFAAKTLGFSFTEIIVLFMLVQITALLGSAMWARPTDTRGPKFVVRLTLVQWTAVTVLAFLVQDKWHFWVVAIVAGTGLGAVQAASRTFMATLVPRDREAQFFGFYSLVGKTGAVLGPVVFGAVSWLLSGNQRAAIVAVGLFFIVGLVLLGRVDAGGPTVAHRGEPAPRREHPSR